MTRMCLMTYDLNYSLRFLIELIYIDSINKSIYLCLDLYFLLSFTIILLLICYSEQCRSTSISCNLLSAPFWQISSVSEIFINHSTVWLIDMILAEIRSCYVYKLNRIVNIAILYLKYNYAYYYFYVHQQCYKMDDYYGFCIDGNLLLTCIHLCQTYKCYDVYVFAELLIIDDESFSKLFSIKTISFLFSTVEIYEYG